MAGSTPHSSQRSAQTDRDKLAGSGDWQDQRAGAAPVLVPTQPTDARHKILEAAASCFMENGFAATSIDDVARSLGATKGMIYHHYRSKTDLFFAVYRRGMELNELAIRPHAESDGRALERLAKMSIAHAIALMAFQPFQRVLGQGVAMHQSGSTTAAQRDTLIELIEIRDRYEARFRELIEQTADELKLETENISVTTKSFLAVMNSTVFWYRPNSDSAETERTYLAQQLVAFALRGLGATINDTFFDDLEMML